MRSRIFKFVFAVVMLAAIVGTLRHELASAGAAQGTLASIPHALAQSSGVNLQGSAMTEVIDRKRAAWNWVRDRLGF